MLHKWNSNCKHFWGRIPSSGDLPGVGRGGRRQGRLCSALILARIAALCQSSATPEQVELCSRGFIPQGALLGAPLWQAPWAALGGAHPGDTGHHSSSFGLEPKCIHLGWNHSDGNKLETNKRVWEERWDAAEVYQVVRLQEGGWY